MPDCLRDLCGKRLLLQRCSLWPRRNEVLQRYLVDGFDKQEAYSVDDADCIAQMTNTVRDHVLGRARVTRNYTGFADGSGGARIGPLLLHLSGQE